MKRVTAMISVLCLITSVSIYVPRVSSRSETVDGERNVLFKYLLPAENKFLYPVSGDTIGYTYWDYQYNVPHMIANDYLGNLHFTWTNLIDPDTSSDHSVYYNVRSANGSWLAQGTGVPVNSGIYQNSCSGISLLPDSREVIAYHMIRAPFNWYTILSVEKSTPGFGEFYSYDIPDSVPGVSQGTIWPVIATTQSGDTNFIHIVSSSVNSDGSVNATYVRCFQDPGSADTAKCESPGWPEYVKVKPNVKLRPNKVPWRFLSSAIAQYTLIVTASKVQKQKVALVWWAKESPHARFWDIFYLESTNNGNDWKAAGNMGMPVQITDYGYYTWKDIFPYSTDAFYDASDNLQIVWTTHEMDLWGYYQLHDKKAYMQNFFHWNQVNGIKTMYTYYPEDRPKEEKASAIIMREVIDGLTKPILQVDEFIENMLPKDIPGWIWNKAKQFDRLLSPRKKLSCSVNFDYSSPYYNYFACIFNDFNEGDTSAMGYPNRDIYMMVSSNGGSTWGPSINLTNTHSADCTADNCESEVSASAAEVADSFVYIQYVMDKDAGCAILDQGEFTWNPVRYLRYPFPGVPAVARIDYYPQVMSVPIWAKDHSFAQESLQVSNLGTTTLQVQLSGPSWIIAAPSSFSITELGATQKVTITLNGGPYADTFLTGKLKILSNNGVVGGGPNFNDTQYVDINFVVTDTFYFAEYDTCKRGVKLAVSNVGNLGGQSDSAGMFWNGNNYLFEGTPVMATNQVPGFGSDTVGFSGMYDKSDFLPVGHLVKIDYPNLKTTVYTNKLALINWRRSNTDPTHWTWFGWTTWSKIIQFDWVPGNIHAVLIKNWWTWRRPPKWWMDVTLTRPAGGYFGIGGDWDVTADFFYKNQGGIIDSLNLVYLRGDTLGAYSYYGGYQFLGAYVKKGYSTNYTAPFALHVGNNTTQMYPFSGYNDDSLWKCMSTPGDYIEPPDSALDRNIVISAVEMLNPDTTTEIGIDYAAVVSNADLVDFVRQAAALKKVKPGDANVDGKVTVSDVVYLVNYLFKGGPEPWLMFSDANGDSKVTVSDVVYLVNYLFKGGPPSLFVVGAKPF